MKKRGRPAERPIDPRRANRVAELRARADMSQETLAAQSGISQQQLSKIENGRAPLTLEEARRLAHALDCSPVDFLTEAEGYTVPETHIAGLAANVKAGFDAPAPHRRISAGLIAGDADRLRAVRIADGHADRMNYRKGAVVVMRALDRPHRLQLGQKIVVRRYRRLESGRRETLELLVGVLGAADGDLILHLKTTLPEVPAAVPIQFDAGGAALDRALGLDAGAVDYAPRETDPAEILGVVVLAIVPE